MKSVPVVAQAASAGWESQAACLDSHSGLFFLIAPSGPALQQIAQAKAICARCQGSECLRFALTTHQIHGVWGGTSEEVPERRLVAGRDSPGAARKSRT